MSFDKTPQELYIHLSAKAAQWYKGFLKFIHL